MKFDVIVILKYAKKILTHFKRYVRYKHYKQIVKYLKNTL